MREEIVARSASASARVVGRSKPAVEPGLIRKVLFDHRDRGAHVFPFGRHPLRREAHAAFGRQTILLIEIPRAARGLVAVQ